MVIALDLINDGLNFDSIVSLSICVVFCPVIRRLKINYTIDFWGKQVINTVTGWSVQYFVGRMFVSPGRAQTFGMRYFEDGINLKILMRIHAGTSSRINGQLGWIDQDV